MAAAVAKWCSKYKTPPVRAALYRTGKKVKGCPPGGVYKVVKHWQPVKAKKKKTKSVKKSKVKKPKTKWRKLFTGKTITPRGIAAFNRLTPTLRKKGSGRRIILDDDE